MVVGRLERCNQRYHGQNTTRACHHQGGGSGRLNQELYVKVPTCRFASSWRLVGHCARHFPPSLNRKDIPLAFRETSYVCNSFPTSDSACVLSMSSTASIASSFIEGAPPGELSDVVNDVKTLTSDNDPALISKLKPAFKKYHEEQLTAIKLPGSSQPVGAALSCKAFLC